MKFGAMLLAEKLAGGGWLDVLVQQLDYLAITTIAMRVAAQLFARTWRQGKPTAHDRAVDGDVILAAQYTFWYPEVVSATTKVGHLSLFV